MALTAKRYKGRSIAIVVNSTTLSHWKEISVTPKYDIENPQGSDAGYKQKVLDLRDCTGTLSFFVNDANNPSTMPAIGDEITTFTILVGSDSLIDALSSGNFGKCRVVSKPYKIGKDAAEVSLDIEWGFID